MTTKLSVELLETSERRSTGGYRWPAAATVLLLAGVAGYLFQPLVLGEPGTGASTDASAAPAALIVSESSGIVPSTDDPADPDDREPALAFGTPEGDGSSRGGDRSGESGPVNGSTSPSNDAAAVTGGFLMLNRPVPVVDTATDPISGNATGFNVAAVTEQIDDVTTEDVVAAVVTVAVGTDRSGHVLLHPGNRPADAIRLAVADSGQFRASHVLVRPDDGGRVAVAIDSPAVDTGRPAGARVTVDVTGIYLAAETGTAGRYRHLGLAEVASLVTATDGSDLALDVAGPVGSQGPTAGQVVLRLNANVGSDGGLVSLLADDGSEYPVSMWPAPQRANPGLGGSSVAVVPVDDSGSVVLRYRGGSTLNVDLVGYFTNAEAEESSSGLLIMSPPHIMGADEVADDDGAVELLIADVSGGSGGGRLVMGTSETATGPSEHLVFNLAEGQRRAGPLWIDDSSTLVEQNISDMSLWSLGRYQP